MTGEGDCTDSADSARTSDHDLIDNLYLRSLDRYASMELDVDLVRRSRQSQRLDLQIGGQVHEAAHLLVTLRLGEALEAIESALKAAGSEPEPSHPFIHAWMHQTHGDILEELGRSSDATEHMQTAIRIAGANNLGDHWDTMVASYIETVSSELLDTKSTMEIFDTLLLQSPRLAQRHTIGRAMELVLSAVGRNQLAAAVGATILQRDDLSLRSRATVTINLGRRLLAAGYLDDADAALRSARRLVGEGPEWIKAASTLTTAEATLDLIWDRPQDAAARLEPIVTMLPDVPAVRTRCFITYATALARIGQPHSALEWLEQAEPVATEERSRRYRRSFLEVKAEVMGILGRTHEQAALLRELVTHIERTRIPESQLVEIDHWLSAWATALEDQDRVGVDIDRQWIVNSRTMNLVAKDLRGPAASLIMAAQLVGVPSSDEDSPNPQVLDLLRAAAAELSLSVDHLADADFIDDDPPSQDSTPTSLTQLVNEAKAATEPVWSLRNVSISVDGVEQHHPLIDNQLTKRLVAGLIRAASAELSSGGTIAISTGPDAQVTIRVDGLDSAGRRSLAERLHLRWLAPHSVLSDPPSGWTGLALSLSKLVVQGGSVRVLDGPDPASEAAPIPLTLVMHVGDPDRPAVSQP